MLFCIFMFKNYTVKNNFRSYKETGLERYNGYK